MTMHEIHVLIVLNKNSLNKKLKGMLTTGIYTEKTGKKLIQNDIHRLYDTTFKDSHKLFSGAFGYYRFKKLWNNM